MSPVPYHSIVNVFLSFFSDFSFVMGDIKSKWLKYTWSPGMPETAERASNDPEVVCHFSAYLSPDDLECPMRRQVGTQGGRASRASRKSASRKSLVSGLEGGWAASILRPEQMKGFAKEVGKPRSPTM